MKKTGLFILLMTLCSAGIFAQAGNDRLAEIQGAAAEKTADSLWVVGGGLGLDFAQLALVQPKVGAGSNRIGFGGLGTVFANYGKDKVSWTNIASLQLGAQRIGGNGKPFEKNIDVIRAASRFGYQLGEGKAYAAIEASAQTLLLPTYEGNLINPEDKTNLIAKFFAPVQFQLSPGIDYKVNEHLSFFLSPASLKIIYVGNDQIAALNVHGNDEGTNRFLAVGANLIAGYNNKFLNDRLVWNSTLNLFSNYLRDPQNVDLLWTNDLGIIIFKNVSLNLVTELFADDDIDVQIDRNGNGIYGEAGELAPSVSFTEALIIKYSFVF
ncbi:MAG: DUF3078 domain-containing protein [Saprospiraceae bacterium]|nr:DUF3078 domain-containing protein [Saprospiraceae bacterium]